MKLRESGKFVEAIAYIQSEPFYAR